MKIMTWGPAKFVIHWFPGPVESFKLSSPALLHTVTGRSVSLPCTPGTVSLSCSMEKTSSTVYVKCHKIIACLFVVVVVDCGVVVVFVVVEFFSPSIAGGCFVVVGFFSLLLWVGGVFFVVVGFFSPIVDGCFAFVEFFSLLLLWVGALSLLCLFLSFYFGRVFCRCCCFFLSPIVDRCFVIIGFFSPTISTAAAVHLQQTIYTNTN